MKIVEIRMRKPKLTECHQIKFYLKRIKKEKGHKFVTFICKQNINFKEKIFADFKTILIIKNQVNKLQKFIIF
jgi:hypothetical protein